MRIVKWRTLYVIKVTFSNEITKVWYMKINSLFKKYFLETKLYTNDEYEDIWTVLDEIMDTGSQIVENPNSELDVKLWIKYTN